MVFFQGTSHKTKTEEDISYRNYENFYEGSFLEKKCSTNFSLFSDDPTQYYNFWTSPFLK